MAKRMVLMVLALVLVLGGVFGWKAFVNYQIDKAMASRKPPPVTVTATQAAMRTWQPTIPSTASLRAVQGVDVTTEVAGKVVKINFESGEEVEEGELLVKLDTSVDRAELEGLKAQLRLNRTELERQRRLVETNATAQSQLDTAQAQFDRTQADVASLRARLDKKSIQAPFTGRIGIRQVDLGEYLSPGDDVVTLQALDPIYADFSIPQRHLRRLEVDQPVELTTDSYPERTFTGRITAVNPKIQESTRNVRVQATLDNPDHALTPGMFGNVAVLLAQENEVITLPQTAITYNPYGDSVYIVQQPEGGQKQQADAQDAEKGGEQQALPTVKRVFVKTGETRGDQVQIREGVDSGQQVVTSGQLKLRQGARVKIDNEITPSDAADPKVAEG